MSDDNTNVAEDLEIAKDKIVKEHECFLSAHRDNMELVNRVADLKKEISSLQSKLKIAEDALVGYGTHDGICILSFFEAGEPTKGGGYRQKIKGKWYQAEPIDKTPKCNCGFQKALNQIGEMKP